MSEHPREIESIQPTGDPAAIAVIARLLRIHNLMILALVAGGLGVVMYVQTTHAYSGARPGWTRWLTAARIVFPIAGLVATFLWSHTMLRRLCRESASGRPPMGRIAAAFFRAKLGSMITMALVVAFADFCLLYGHQFLDIVLVLVPLGIFGVGMRPAHGNVEFFGAMAADAAATQGDSGHTSPRE